jgi:hypothetical protein
MNCETCPNKYIKFASNCFLETNSSLKLFDASVLFKFQSYRSCKEIGDLYILYNGNECQQKPPHTYISNNETNILSFCDETCSECFGPFNNNCNSCDGVNYFETEDYPNQCLKDMPEHYFKDKNLNPAEIKYKARG